MQGAFDGICRDRRTKCSGCSDGVSRSCGRAQKGASAVWTSRHSVHQRAASFSSTGKLTLGLFRDGSTDVSRLCVGLWMHHLQENPETALKGLLKAHLCLHLSLHRLWLNYHHKHDSSVDRNVMTFESKQPSLHKLIEKIWLRHDQIQYYLVIFMYFWFFRHLFTFKLKREWNPLLQSKFLWDITMT